MSIAALSVILATVVGSYLNAVAVSDGIKILEAPPVYMDQKEIWGQEHAVRLVNLLRRVEDPDSVAGLEDIPKCKMNPTKLMNVLTGAGNLQSSESARRPQRFQEYFGDNDTYNDDKILYIENPVEARLPGHRISIKLLREIMIARSVASNVLFTTTSEPTTTLQEGKPAAEIRGPSTESTNTVSTQQWNEPAATGASNATDKVAGKVEDKGLDKADNKSASKAEDKTAGEAEDKSADKADEKGAGNAKDKGTDKAADKEAGKDEGKSADKAEVNGTDKAEDKGADKAKDKGTDKAEEKGADKAKEKGTDKAEDKGADKAKDRGADKAEVKT